jgi:hypothetical protein
MNSRRSSSISGKRLNTPLSVVTWEDERGRAMVTIVCKATFDLTATGAIPSAVSSPIRTEDELWPGLSSPRHVSDLARTKTGFELYVSGHVHAPGGRPALAVRARVRAAEIEKCVDVHGERAWDANGQLCRLPFLRMPVAWERSGPYDVRAARSSDGLAMVPNFVPESHEPRAMGDAIPCTGLGALSTAHADRSGRNVAPPDQRALAYRAGEILELDHLHPTLSFVRTQLPALLPVAAVRARDLAEDVVPLWADTLVIDSDAGRIELVFRGHVQLPRPDDTLEVVLYDVAPHQEPWQPAALDPQATLPAMPYVSDAFPFIPGPASSTPGRTASSTPPVGPVAPTFGPMPDRATPAAEASPRKCAATLEMAQPEAALAPAPAPALVSAPALAPAPPRPDALGPADYGALLAELELGASSREAVLEPVGLDDAAWAGVSDHFERAARDGLRRGRVAMRDTIDGGYVEALERRRGAIDAVTCARARLAQENDHEAELARELDWPPGALPRVIRVCFARAASDPRLRVSLASALQAQRAAAAGA